MIERIKKTRVKIDRWMQMVQSMTAVSYIQMPLDMDFDIKKWIELSKQTMMFPVDGNYSIKPAIQSTYITNVYNSLRLSKAWLGTMLEEINEDMNVEITDDIYVSDGEVQTICNEQDWVAATNVERINWLLKEIKDFIANGEDFSEDIPYIELEQQFLYQHLTEVTFYLNFILKDLINETGQTN